MLLGQQSSPRPSTARGAIVGEPTECWPGSPAAALEPEKIFDNAPIQTMLRTYSLRLAKWPAILDYGVPVICVVVATAVLWLMQGQWRFAASIPMFLLAVTISTLIGGILPGVLAIALSILTLAFFAPLAPSSALGSMTLSRVAVLAVVGPMFLGVVVALRNAAEWRRRASRELYRSNEELPAENIEHARAEDVLQESQGLLQLVLATMPLGVAVTDRAGDIILANEASKRIWGGLMISGHERWAQSKGFWHGSGRRIESADWASVRALSHGQTSLNELIDIETHVGQRKTIQNSAAPIRNAQGSIVGAVIVNEDVTDRVRAEEALRESTDRLHRLSRRLLEVQEEERNHLARELHDEFGQLLATITLHLHAARLRAGEAAQPALDECMALLQRAGAQMRSLALDLRPAMLEEAGLDATLRWLAEGLQQRTGIVTHVAGHLDRVSGTLAIACFRVAQEALTNVVRHAQARRVWIELSSGDHALELVIRDDGVGFDVTRILQEAPRRGHLGLLGMRERVQVLGGSLEIDSRPGNGTQLRMSLPLIDLAAQPEESAG